MNTENWLAKFDADKAKFEWFFIKYGFDIEWKQLNEARVIRQIGKMKNIMNRVWFELPDAEFNIMMNPVGWDEFLYLLED